MQAKHYSSSRWLPRVQARSKVKLRLICLPYAGGSAAVFNNWPTHLPATIDIYPIQLPGRCNRFNEPPFTQLAPLLAALAEAIAPYLDTPIAFFGHSMGELICFELAHTLRSAELRQPLHLFVSGHQAPRLEVKEALHTLPDAELIVALAQLNGTPTELLEDRQLMALMLLTLRADLTVCETYHYIDRAPLDCPVTAFGGVQDIRVGYRELEMWGKETHGPFSLHSLPGDHFFLRTYEALLLQIISYRTIGIDQEPLCDAVPWRQTAPMVFSACEKAELYTYPDSAKPHAFLRGWTRKEAYIKARGEGLSLPLDRFTVPLVRKHDSLPNHMARNRDTSYQWWLHFIEPMPSYVAALVIEGGGPMTLKYLHWPGLDPNVELTVGVPSTTVPLRT